MTARHDRPGFDLEITQMTRRKAFGGTRVRGAADGFRFEAVVADDHAADPADELGRTRLVRLEVWHRTDGGMAYRFDRGPAVGPADGRVERVVRFLTRELAGRVGRADAARFACRRPEPVPPPPQPGKAFATAEAAIQFAGARKPVAILRDGRYRVVTQATADRLAAAGRPFAYLHEVDGRVITVPVND